VTFRVNFPKDRSRLWRVHPDLTIFITCAGIAAGIQDTLACGDCRSVALDIWILATIIGYWLFNFVYRQKVGSAQDCSSWHEYGGLEDWNKKGCLASGTAFGLARHPIRPGRVRTAGQLVTADTSYKDRVPYESAKEFPILF